MSARRAPWARARWLYAPLEVGCTLVRNPAHLNEAFGYTPAYYHFENDEPSPPPNYFELGPQNSRGLRALKVWMGLRQAGRDGLAQSIADDIRLSRELCIVNFRTDRADLEALIEAVVDIGRELASAR